MKKTSVIIYSVFAIAIYFFSIIYFCSSLYYEYQEGSSKTEETFNFISNKLIQNSSHPDFEFETKRLLNKFSHSSDRIAEVTFKINGAYLFLYPENPIQDSRYIKNLAYSYSDGKRKCTFEAKMYLIRPSMIYQYGKKSFLIILAVTTITFILIIYTSLTSSPHAENDDKSEENENRKEETTANVNTAKVPAPRTKLQDKVSFNTTLTDKLRISIANEKEFAIIVMKFLGIEKGTEEYQKLLELLDDRLKVQNLIFEDKEDTLIVLKQDTNLDENLTLVENTLNEVERTFKDLSPICYANISNRNLRIVTGERLLFEAEAALEHAVQAEEKVIAFRANTEQYNEFMNQN